MIAPEKMSLSDFVSRRMHPVKVTLMLLRHEASLHTKGENTEINKHVLHSAVSTLELFVEDYEKLIQTTQKAAASATAERKFVEDSKPLIQA
jgi:hypothetical protein